MRIDVFTIFPDVVDSYCRAALLGRARAQGALDLRVHDLRSGALDTRRTVDDSPFGGGAGMVLMAEPLFGAVEAVEADEGLPRPLLLLGPGGRRFDQAVAARELAAAPGGSHCCAGATRASTSASPITWLTGSSQSVTTCSPAVRWRPWWLSRRWPASCPG